MALCGADGFMYKGFWGSVHPQTPSPRPATDARSVQMVSGLKKVVMGGRGCVALQ